MSYIYKLQNIDTEKLKELGYEILPETICQAPENQKYYYKMVLQDTNSECVLSLIKFYNDIADKICADKAMRKVHADIGIKFRKKKNTKHYYLMMNKNLRMMFRAWRIELDLEEADVYFTISDGSLPKFYDAEQVIEKYCKAEIEELVNNNLVYKEEIASQVQ